MREQDHQKAFGLLWNQSCKQAEQIDAATEIILKFCAECDWKNNCTTDIDECKVKHLREVLK